LAGFEDLQWRGANRQEHLLIKPVDEGLENSLVVTTDQRTYHLNLTSTAATYMASVAWRYPSNDNLMTAAADDNGAGASGDDVMNAQNLDLNNLNFNYTVKVAQGSTQDWMPNMIFDDGSKTYIKFPLQIQEAPTLFIGNSAKSDQIVNYRVQGNYYVVDGLFAMAQLRGGMRGENIVQIVRNK